MVQWSRGALSRRCWLEVRGSIPASSALHFPLFYHVIRYKPTLEAHDTTSDIKRQMAQGQIWQSRDDGLWWDLVKVHALDHKSQPGQYKWAMEIAE